MTATVGDLIAEAERHLWDLAAETAPDADALGAAWPLFQRRSQAALAVAPPINNSVAFMHYNGLRHSARQAVDRGVRQLRDATPHAGIQRASHLLGAAADLMHGGVVGEAGPAGTSQAEAWQARIAEMIHTTAHTTRVALTRDPGTTGRCQARTRRHATELGLIEYHAAALSAQVLPEHRRTPYDDLAATTPGREGQLADVLASWRAHAGRTLALDNPTPSVADIQRVTVDLALLAAHARVILTADAAQRGVDPDVVTRLNQDFVAVARGWRDLLESWPRVFGATSASDLQTEATDGLRTTLNAITRPDGHWLDATELAAHTHDWPATVAGVRQVMASTHQLAVHYARLPAAHAETGKLFAPARALSAAARAVDGVKLNAAQQELLAARRLGRWVVLQPADVHAVTAAAAAQPDRTRQLRDAVYATIGAARRSSADQALAATLQGRPNSSAFTIPAPDRSRHDGWRSPHHRHLSTGPEIEL
jgi:hypothetical protein